MIELAYVVVGILLAILLLALRRPILARMAVRNFLRRRSQAAIAVGGLLIGTAIISSSMVVGDTMDQIFVDDTLAAWGLVDLTVTIPAAPGGESGRFDHRFYVQLKENLTQPDTTLPSGYRGDVVADSVSPAFLETSPVEAIATGKARPALSILGIEPENETGLGTFSVGGEENHFIGLGDDEALVNAPAAEELGIARGDLIRIHGIRPAEFTVRSVVDATGKGVFLRGDNIFITLRAAQTIYDAPGMINAVRISAQGGLLDSTGYSDALIDRAQYTLDRIAAPEDLGIVFGSENGRFTRLHLYGTRSLITSELIDITRNHPSTNGLIHSHAPYLVLPPDLASVPRPAAAGGGTINTTVVGIDDLNPLFGDYYDSSGAPVSAKLGTAGGRVEALVSESLAGPANLTKGSETSVRLSFGSFDIDVPLVVKSVIRMGPNDDPLRPTGNGAFPPELWPHLLPTLVFPRGAVGQLEDIVTAVRYEVKPTATVDALETGLLKALSDGIRAEDLGLVVYGGKKEGIEAARGFGEQMTEIFLILGSFSVAAGIILVVNIFSMLAEERKREMGVSRAVGMSRGQLVQTFLYEGAIYALIAAAIGTVIGVAVGAFIIYAFSAIFSDPDARLEAAIRPDSMIFAFALGALLTLGTVIAAAWRVSRLNIVRAIRDIPEPPPEKGSLLMLVGGAILLFLGVALSIGGVTEKVSMLIMLGPSVAAVGAGLLAAQYVGYRAPFTLSGAFIIFWIVGPLGTGVIDSVGARGETIQMFAASGMLLVTGGILVIVANSDVIIGLLNRLFSRRPALVAPVRVAISYPMAYRIRTGNSLAMFSLIIFTVVVISMVQTFDEQLIRGSLDQQSGGYGLIAGSDPDHPVPGFEALLNSEPDLAAAKPERFAAVRSAGVEIRHGEGRSTFYPLRGVDQRFSEENLYSLKSIDPLYASPRELWKAVQDDPTLAVIDGSAQPEAVGPDFGGFRISVGDSFTIRTPLGENLAFRVAGIMDQLLVNGAFIREETVREAFGAAEPDVHLLKVADGRELEAKRALEDKFALKGMSVRIVSEEIEDFIRINDNVLTLVKGFMGIGMVVGIAGLGIVTVRAVAERRQEIGTLKALGFRDRMVFAAFLMEVSFVAVIGILLGVALGLGLSWKIFEYYFTDLAEFIVPWTVILVICAIAYVATVLCTVSPSLRASRMPPAEAVRYIE